VTATGLIHNCFYPVYVSDGLNLISYKLPSTDLEYEGIVANLWGESGHSVRSEMEHIRVNETSYRIDSHAVDFSAVASYG
jgi:hypothetical protein